MAVNLDASPGSASANSYATLAEANTYHESHLYGSVWTAAADALKINALITATRLLDENVVWVGWPTNAGQALGWPRAGGLLRSGYAIQSGEIPIALKNATAEFARLLIDAGGMPNSGSDIPAGLKRIKAGSVELEYDPALSSGSEDALPIPVLSMIGFLIETRAQHQLNVPLERM